MQYYCSLCEEHHITTQIFDLMASLSQNLICPAMVYLLSHVSVHRHKIIFQVGGAKCFIINIFLSDRQDV
jgi:hypothetical protein